MKFDPAAIRLVSVTTLPPGSIFVIAPEARRALDFSVCVVVSGGRVINQNYIVPLDGPRAFKPYKWDATKFLGMPFEPPSPLSLQFDAPLVSLGRDYSPGLAVISEDLSGFSVEISHGYDDISAVVSFSDWHLHDQPHSGLWTPSWSLSFFDQGATATIAKGRAP